jgi:hypothetical protein
MQQADNSDSSSFPTAECEACGWPMRLILIEPDEHDSNVDKRHFACACGATANRVVVHAE